MCQQWFAASGGAYITEIALGKMAQARCYFQETHEINQGSEIIGHYYLHLINCIYICSNISNDIPLMLSQKWKLNNKHPMSFLGKTGQDYENYQFNHSLLST